MNQHPSNKPLGTDNILIDLLTCFVATNGVGLAKGHEISQELHRAGIASIDTESDLIQCEEESVYSYLNSSSYPRGEYVARLVANRIKRSIDQINHQGGAKFLESLHLMNESDTRAALSPLFGVGEKFVDNYLIISPRAR